MQSLMALITSVVRPSRIALPIRALVPADANMAQFALRWILIQDAVSVVIPGAKNAEQSGANAEASRLSALSEETMSRLRDIYERSIAQHVHHRW